MKLLAALILISAYSATGLAQTVLTCKSASPEGFLISLVLQKNGDNYSGKMKSVMEDGVIDIQIKAPEVTATATKYILVEDHDFKATLAVYKKHAVVITESVDDIEAPTDVQFLICK